jgi:hypothetical protein
MTVKVLDALPDRASTFIKSYDYVLVDEKQYMLIAYMDNGDVLRLTVPDISPSKQLMTDRASVHVIDFKLSALTAMPMSHAPDLMAVMTNFCGQTVDTNRPQYRQLVVHSTNIQSFKAS